MKVIFVAGTFGSGTSAVAGALDRLGVDSMPPHFITNDLRTPNSYESMAFRELVNEFTDEPTLSLHESGADKFVQGLRDLLSQANGGSANAVVLKMPLASICVPQIIKAVDPYIIWVHRPLSEVEASRLRRKWPPLYGAAGAGVICSKLITDLIEHKKSYLAVSYLDLQKHTRREITNIMNFCGLQELGSRIDAAVEFVRKDAVKTGIGSLW
jgi:hypothetical protein